MEFPSNLIPFYPHCKYNQDQCNIKVINTNSLVAFLSTDSFSLKTSSSRIPSLILKFSSLVIKNAKFSLHKSTFSHKIVPEICCPIAYLCKNHFASLSHLTHHISVCLRSLAQSQNRCKVFFNIKNGRSTELKSVC